MNKEYWEKVKSIIHIINRFDYAYTMLSNFQVKSDFDGKFYDIIGPCYHIKSNLWCATSEDDPRGIIGDAASYYGGGGSCDSSFKKSVDMSPGDIIDKIISGDAREKDRISATQLKREAEAFRNASIDYDDDFGAGAVFYGPMKQHIKDRYNNVIKVKYEGIN